MISLLLATAISALSFGIVLGRWLSTGGRFLEPERASVDELHVEPWDAPQSPYRLPPKEPAPSLDEAIEQAVTATPGVLRPKPLPEPAPLAVRNPSPATKVVRS